MRTLKISALQEKRARKILRKKKIPLNKLLRKALNIGLNKFEKRVSIRYWSPLKSHEELTDEEKAFVAANLHIENPALALKFGKPIRAFIRYKMEVLKDTIRKYYLEKSDGEIATLTGYHIAYVAVTRARLGLKRPKREAFSRSMLNVLDPKEVQIALTKKGKSLVDILKEKNIQTSRELLSKWCQSHDIKMGRKHRHIEWYANRLGKPELIDPVYVKKVLDEQRSISAAAHELKIGNVQLTRIMEMHGLLPKPKKAIEWIELTCKNPHCKRKERKFNISVNELERRLKHSEIYCQGTERQPVTKEDLFCSKRCFGQFFGNNYGFGRNKADVTSAEESSIQSPQ